MSRRLGGRSPGMSTREVTDEHQHRPAHERGDRPALARPHVLLLVGPGGPGSHRDRPRGGRLPVHARGPADPRLQQPADVREHRPRRSTRDRRDHGPGDPAAVCPAGLRDGGPGAPGREARRDPARRHGQGLLHARRLGGRGERDPARPPLLGPPQDPGALPQLPRRHARLHDADGRSAALGERARDRGRRALPGHAPLGREGAAAGRREPPGTGGRDPVRGRAHHRGGLPRDDRGHERDPHPARPTATSRASASCATDTGS